VSPPVVGLRYSVPCVRVGSILLPTLGPWHVDPVLAPEVGLHVHYDPRFFDLVHLLPEVRESTPDLSPESVLLVIAHLPMTGRTWDPNAADPLVAVEMECLREMPPFPRGHSAAPWVELADALYAGSRAERDARGCLRCPHRGTALDDLPERKRTRPHRECIHGLRIGIDGIVF
jgi:hypothetical protein